MIRVRQRMGSTELDFTEATFTASAVLLELDVIGGPVESRVPVGVAVAMTDVRTRLGSAGDHRRGVAESGSLVISIRGTVTWGSREVR